MGLRSLAVRWFMRLGNSFYSKISSRTDQDLQQARQMACHKEIIFMFKEKGTSKANCEMAAFPLLHLVVRSGQENLAMTQPNLGINFPVFCVC